MASTVNSSCTACEKELKQGEMLLRCALCKTVYHSACLNMTSAFYRENAVNLARCWRCPSCVNVSLRVCPRKDSTPVKALFDDANMSCDDLPLETSVVLDKLLADAKAEEKVASQLQDPNNSTTSTPFSLEQLAVLLDSKFESNKTEILKKLDDNKSEIMRRVKEDLHTEINRLKFEFTQTTDLLFGKFNDLEKEVSTLHKKVKTLEDENLKLETKLVTMSKTEVSSELENTILELRSDLNDREQAALSNDVEITGIPEFDGESIVHIALSVGSKLGLQLTEHDLVSVSRVGSKTRTAAYTGNDTAESKLSSAPRPRPIAVRLSRRATRDELLKQARTRRGATTADLGLPPHTATNFYINERLTKANRVLFAKALDAAKNVKPTRWKFLWTRDGRILARQTQDSKIYQIRSLEDISRIISSTSNDCQEQQQL